MSRLVSRALDLLIVCGTSAFFFFGAFDLDLGTVNEMGPGFLPAVFGGLGLCLGLLVLLLEFKPQRVQGHGLPDIKWPLREGLFVGLSIVLFAVLLEWLGLFAAAFLGVMVCSAASTGVYRWRRTASWALVLSGLTCLIFIGALGLPMKLFPV
jgi:putative tricarboxylic transport membrane protein